MTTQEFLDKYTGVGIDWDGFYGNQCMDEFLQYNQDVVHAPRVFGNAKDVWNTYPTAFYTRYDNTPDAVPHLGDVIIWGTGIGADGHIAICKEADVNHFISLDQNWNNVQTCELITHNYNAVLGWIRPIVIVPPVEVPPVVNNPPEVVNPVVNTPEPSPTPLPVETPPTTQPTAPQPSPTMPVSGNTNPKPLPIISGNTNPSFWQIIIKWLKSWTKKI